MIQSISVKNFLSFKEKTEFSFEASSDNTLESQYVFEPVKDVRLLKMIMLFGSNGSGKTNFIKIFKFLYEFIVEGDLSSFQPFNYNNSNKIGEFEIVFYAEKIKYIYKLKVDKNSVIEEKLYNYPSQKPALIFDRSKTTDNKINVDYGKKLNVSNVDKGIINKFIKNDKSILFSWSANYFESNDIYTIQNWFKTKFFKPINTEDSISNLVDDLLLNDEKKLKHSVIKYMKQAGFSISDLEYKTVTTPIDNDTIKEILESLKTFENKDNLLKELQGSLSLQKIKKVFKREITDKNKTKTVEVNFDEESKGTKRYFEVLTIILNQIKEEGILAIDELEYSLHPLIVIHLISDYIRQAGESQLIFTSNNVALLNYKDRLRRDALWILDKDKNGSTIYKTVSNITKFRKELSYFNYYLKGEFGGIPQVVKPFTNLTNK